MKARVKSTGEIVELYPSIHKECDYDGSDGYSYVKEDIIILDDEPDYWTRLEHTYAGMAMQGMMSGWWSESIANIAKSDKEHFDILVHKANELAHALVEQLKMKQE